MTETAQTVPLVITKEPPRSEFQLGRPERVTNIDESGHPTIDYVEKVFEGPAGQLSVAAHNLSMRGV